MMYEYGFPFFGGFGSVIMIVFWGLIIWGLVTLVRGGTGVDRTQGSGVREKSALDILKERYAKGEINKEEFEQKKGDLI